MAQSATSSGAPNRSARRHAVAHRISVCAQELAAEHGLDGFTMEELAERVGVSRRTLFNYFPSKDDAVLGAMPDIDPERIGEFRAGGPTGDLVEDLAVVVRSVLDRRDFAREELALARRVMLANPRLVALSYRRFEEIVESFTEHIRVRTGSDFDRHRARAAMAVVIAVFHLAMDRYLSDARRRDLTPLFTETLRTTRELFA